MKRSNVQPLKNILQEYVAALKMSHKLKEVSIINSWEEVVGKTVSRATKDIYIKDKKLYVELKSSVVRHELLNIKDSLIKRLNEVANERLIEEIVLL